MADKFEIATEYVKSQDLGKVSDNNKLKLYGLFKQASEGDNTASKPGMFDLKGKAKWEAWTANKGMDKTKAKEAYVLFVEELFGEKL